MPLLALKSQPGFAQSKSRHRCRQLLPAPGILSHLCLRKAGETQGWVLHRAAPPVKSVATKRPPPLHQKLSGSQITIIIMYNYHFICKGRAGSLLPQPISLGYCGFAGENVLGNLRLQTSTSRRSRSRHLRSRDIPRLAVLGTTQTQLPHGRSVAVSGHGFLFLAHP